MLSNVARRTLFNLPSTRTPLRSMSSSVQAIIVPDAPKAVGPYSHATVHNGLAYISGCIPLVPSTMKIVEGGIEAQVAQALSNLDTVVTGVGSSKKSIVKCALFLKDMGDFATVNKLYAEFFEPSGHKPARTAVEVARLPLDVLFEIEAIAAVE